MVLFNPLLREKEFHAFPKDISLKRKHSKVTGVKTRLLQCYYPARYPLRQTPHPQHKGEHKVMQIREKSEL